MKRNRIYIMRCKKCGHEYRDTIMWNNCLVKGCTGKYEILEEKTIAI